MEVRRRQFVVAEVARSALPTNGRPPQHLVTLASIEDDALGEELEVVWEIEAGARILERAGLPTPDGFDDPDRLSAFLHAVRWGALTDADYQTLQSPFRSGITIEDYQLDPVVRAIQMPRANLLIADDVGLGKTIETGLVVQELLLRHRARTVLVVCPASLQIKWRDEMKDRFGLEFRIVDTQLLKELRRSRGIHVNPWTHFPRLIASIDWLKSAIPLQMFRDVLPAHPTYPRPFDILIVDEAHNIAPSGSENYVLDSQRTQAIRALTPHFEHRLFLTATPHNGYQESFTSLLELLDDQRFARGIVPDREQLARVMVRRLKEDIVDWRGEPRFPKREIIPIEVEYSAEEKQLHKALVEYSDLRQKSSTEEGHRYATHFVLKLLKKRLFSSPAAFAQTLEKHRRTLAGVTGRRPIGKQAVRVLRRAIGETEEDYADDERFEEMLGEAVDTATTLIPSISDRERNLLHQMTEWAESARNRADSKVEALVKWLESHLRPEGNWTDARVIVFTEYRATQNYLVEMLATHGFTEGNRLMTMYGGMDVERREQIKAAFQASPQDSEVRILVATDSASEGIDLQNHCNLMIHAEIPWNPNRLEQRNGRIDRHGQRKREVLIHHFVGTAYKDFDEDADLPVGDLEADLEFLMRAARKIERIRQDLGRVGTVIATQVEEAMLGARHRLDTTKAEEEAKGARRLLTIERRIGEQIERLHERLLESRTRLEISPATVEQVVTIGLELAGQPRLREINLPGIPEETRVFEMPVLTGTWQLCLQGLVHPHTGRRRAVTFDHSLLEGRDDIVLLHLEHRLVQMCLRLLRAEVWAPDSGKRLHRVAAGVVSDGDIDTPAVIAHARLVVVGENRHRLHEEVVTAGGAIRQGRFARLKVGQVDALIDYLRTETPKPDVLDDLRRLWPKMAPSIIQALEARKTDRMEHLVSTLERRRDRDIDDIARVLRELQTSVETQLAQATEPEQLTMWGDAERDQLRRNVNTLRARVGSIPLEIERESDAIRRRYSNIEARVFPVALTFVVPEALS